MTFSQSTPFVSRVPYKEVSDTLTIQSRVSHVLECKDLCRSNPDSALLDLTQPTCAGALSLSESFWDNHPMPQRQPSVVPSASIFYLEMGSCQLTSSVDCAGQLNLSTR